MVSLSPFFLPFLPLSNMLTIYLGFGVAQDNMTKAGISGSLRLLNVVYIHTILHALKA